ncbi:MAG: hypothetical protein ACYCOX_15765, partial [Acidobacteriaceae bacterium]
MPVWTLYGIRRGIATTSWPEKDGPTQPGVLGLPHYHADRCQDECRACADVCLPGALSFESCQAG